MTNTSESLFLLDPSVNWQDYMIQEVMVYHSNFGIECITVFNMKCTLNIYIPFSTFTTYCWLWQMQHLLEWILFWLHLVLTNNTFIFKCSSLYGCYTVSNCKQLLFRGLQCLQIQGQAVQSLLHCLTLKMKGLCFIKRWITIYQLMGHNTSEDLNLHEHYCQNNIN